MKTRFALLSLGLLLAAVVARAEPVLAGHKGLASQSLDAESTKAVLLGKKVTLGDARVVIVIAKSCEAQEQFLQQHVGMSTSQFQNHWRRLFMTGGGSAPKIVENESEASKVAAETPGAIAVVDKAKSDGLAVLATGK